MSQNITVESEIDIADDRLVHKMIDFLNKVITINTKEFYKQNSNLNLKAPTLFIYLKIKILGMEDSANKKSIAPI